MKTEENKLDLSKIVVGSRVTFVVEVDHIKDTQAGGVFIVFPDKLLSIEPPAFDWADVKPGMRFVRNNQPYWYIGPKRNYDDEVCVEDFGGATLTFIKSDLTPAPEGET